jgi:DNA-binding response OmpR family regulator
MNKILICDDEPDIVSALQIYLKSEGFDVISAANGKEAVDTLKEQTDIKLILMDVMMPVMDGIAAMAEIRTFSNVPIIMLTAKSEDADKVMGLTIGADDYVTKPFNPLELVARVKSNVRRYTSLGKVIERANVYTSGGLVVDDNAKKVTVYGEDIRLTPIEYKILAFLAKNKGKVYSIDQIYENIWGDISVRTDNTIAVHIRHIREKIEVDPREPKFLKVVWGVGYKIEDDRR